MENIKHSVHKVLTGSYLSYFLLITIGLFFDIFFPIKFYFPNAQILTIIFFALGPILILWAQKSSKKTHSNIPSTQKMSFNNGPYKYLRNPTHLGLIILVAGYAFAIGSAVLFLTLGLSYVISNVFFRKHESILESRYGEDYTKYKTSVRKIM